ncbi:hypothetical protein FXO37_24081 [Capsicum annuum]|nr:hypothetical protein FXO37_24081 [Capsicum annuum]
MKGSSGSVSAKNFHLASFAGEAWKGMNVFSPIYGLRTSGISTPSSLCIPSSAYRSGHSTSGSNGFPGSQPSPTDHFTSYPSLIGRDSSQPSPVGRDSSQASPICRDSLQPSPVGRDSSQTSLVGWNSSQPSPIGRDSSQPSPDSSHSYPVGPDSSQSSRSIHSTSHLGITIQDSSQLS